MSHYVFASNADELWYEMMNRVLKHGELMGSRDGSCAELTSVSMELTNTSAILVSNQLRCASVEYACAETLWYLSGSNEIDVIKRYAPQYARFSDDGVTANGAYGHRWTAHPDWTRPVEGLESPHETQLSAVVSLLKQYPNTRQAVLSCWSPSDLRLAAAGASKDIPCTLAIQFLLRRGYLDAIVTMRSQDLWLGFPYDVFAFCCVQRLVALAVGAKPGTFTLNVGSLHLYERDRVRVNLKNAEDFRDRLSVSSMWREPDVAHIQSIAGPNHSRIGDAIKSAVNLQRGFIDHDAEVNLSSVIAELSKAGITTHSLLGVLLFGSLGMRAVERLPDRMARMVRQLHAQREERRADEAKKVVTEW